MKFDVTSSDGGGNGFNYEDGTLSPEEVRVRQRAIRAFNTCIGDEVTGGDPRDGTFQCPLAKPHPFFGTQDPDWLGAQTTEQRWYVDDVLNMGGNDRTLRTVFTHDHFGPSTHQQVGLYAGLVVEPYGSQWYHNESGVVMRSRDDGGPTSWQAVIEGVTSEEVYREFLLEFSDFQHAYLPGPSIGPANSALGLANPALAVNPPGRVEEWDQLLSTKPWVYEKPFFAGRCPGGVAPPCPEAVTSDDPGTFVVNYRNEPVATRIYDGSGAQATGTAGDLSHVFRSNVTRAIPALNTQPTVYQPLTRDIKPKDPFTPLLRAYENVRVQVRILVGGQEEEHNFSVDGVRWLSEPSESNSGFRGSQMMGISEHFEFEIPSLPKSSTQTRGFVDYLWRSGAAVDDLWNGNWGLMRAYQSANATLKSLSTNPTGSAPALGQPGDYIGICPRDAPVRTFDISAVAARDVLPNGYIEYNTRLTGLDLCTPGLNNGPPSCNPSGLSGPLIDTTGLMFVYDSDLVTIGSGSTAQVSLAPGAPIEPLILRANAGDCIEVNLTNRIREAPSDLPGYNLMPNIIDRFNANKVAQSHLVGLHPQLVSFDVTKSEGLNVGFNPVQTIGAGKTGNYQWYAGQIQFNYLTGQYTPVPTEFGSINLTSSDPIKHSNKGLVGALIIEPEGATWAEDSGTRAAATVWVPNAPVGSRDYPFREFVTVYQSDVNLYYGNGGADFPTAARRLPVRPLLVNEDPAEVGQKAVNYKTEPVWFRKGYLPETDPGATRHFQFADAFSNDVIGELYPETPVFLAKPGHNVRFRVLNPAGHAANSTFGVHGHIWEEQPYVEASTVLDRDQNLASEWKGTQHGHGPSNHFDSLLKHGAGGAFGIAGDYMWRDYVPWMLSNGIWGILKVVDTGVPDPQPVPVDSP